MSELTVYAENDTAQPIITTNEHAEITRELAGAGVSFERWETDKAIAAGDAQDEIISAYRDHIDRLITDHGYATVDVVSLSPDNPDKEAMRQKFLDEHTHSEDEVRFFVAGCGLFSLHVGERVYEVLCEKGDLISVPANTRHWFDMGPNPSFVAIRLFNNPAGWVAKFTGSDISSRFSRLEN